MQSIVDGLNYLLQKVEQVLSWFSDLVAVIFTTAWTFAKDVMCWGLEQALALVVSILSTFDFSGLASYASAWAGLPQGTADVLSAIGLTTAVGIVVTAIGIRILLQLIPFVRLGS